MISVAMVTFREMIRERFVHIIIFITAVMFLFSLLLGSLSFDEQTRILIHLGLASIQISIVGISIFVGANLISKEIERQTCLLVLARPITRTQFYVGKFLGVVGINFIISILLGIALWAFAEGAVYLHELLTIVWGSFLEATILLAVAMFFSQIMRPAIALFSSIGIFIIGNWLEELVFFAKKSQNPVFESVARVIHDGLPQLFLLNWRSYHLLEKHLFSLPQISWASIHALGWTLLLILLGAFAFRRKDLV
jgi:ABC-type transport system involved in multi-copper enzyme maturation permease subunit